MAGGAVSEALAMFARMLRNADKRSVATAGRAAHLGRLSRLSYGLLLDTDLA